jgi:heavy metal sensor kinase
MLRTLFFKTIKFRLTLWYLCVIALLLALFGVSAYFLLAFQLHENLDDSLSTRALELESTVTIQDGRVAFAGQISELVLVYDVNARLLRRYGPEVQLPGVDHMVRLALLGQSTFASETPDAGQEIRVYAKSFTIPPDRRAVIVVGKPSTEIKNVLNTVRSIFLFSGLFACFLAAIGGSVLATRALGPVVRMARAAEQIGETNLSRRVEVQSEDELGMLASTLNHMIERLEAAFSRQRQFTADASHELRTPLAVIEAESTLALEKERPSDEYRQSLEVVSQEAAYMSTMLSDMLLMARGDSGKEPFRLEKVNLKGFLTDLSASVAKLAVDKGLRFGVTTIENLTVKGDAVKLKQLFLNIIENAVRYTPSGGSVCVSTADVDGFAVVSVSDTGIGIPAEQLPLIFQRFYRVDKARSRAEGGAGLGLAIAKYIAEAHGGRIEVESQVGKGSVFRVFLPSVKFEGAQSRADRDLITLRCE